MPRRIPNFRPRAQVRPPENRPTAAARGYCSAAWRRLRKAVIARDGGICQACGRIVTGQAHIDHIIPKSRGGRDELPNLQLLHHECHSRKTAREDS